MSRENFQSYKELHVWRVSIELVGAIYHLTKSLPPDERFGMTSQIRRAAISIPANIAEGYGRSHRGDYLHHLSIARGSLMEVETHLTLIEYLHFATADETAHAWDLATRAGQMLTKLIRSLKPSS